MTCPVVYDVTRLTSRLFKRTPNGIDRVDIAFGGHFLKAAGAARSGAIFVRPFGPRLLPRESALGIVEAIAAHLGEDDDPDLDPSFQRIKDWLGGRGGGEGAGVLRIVRQSQSFLPRTIDWISRHGLPLGRSMPASLPQDARYLNVSQYPLSVDGAFDWLPKRPDVRPVFFIHDLLPLEMPEYFRAVERERHVRRLCNVARFAAAVIVSTESVKTALRRRLSGMGRTALPILVAPPPVAPVFAANEPPDPALGAHPYFVLCSTLEPRKNHLMILHVWRELARRRIDPMPKLVLIGERGWDNENVVDMLERCPSLRGHVLEASGLQTRCVKRLLQGARALLMPTFAEGYGLPVAEALAVGTPVIASEIPVLRETVGDAFVGLDPLDGEGWLRTIEAFARSERRQANPALGASKIDDYFGRIEEFIEAL